MTEQSDASAANLVAVATAGAQGERLAIVETQITDIKSDVGEIKVDVKTLLAGQAARDGVGAYFGRAVPWVALIVSTVTAFILTAS